MDDSDQGRSLLENLGRLWVHGVEMDTSSITGEAPVASIPPAVLAAERYWCIKDRPQKKLDLDFKNATRVNTVHVLVMESVPSIYYHL